MTAAVTPGPEEEIGGGTNARSLNDAIGTTGPGVPDEALAEGETLDDELVSDQGGDAARTAEPGPEQAGR